MAFDLASAKPLSQPQPSGGFDLASAKPVGEQSALPRNPAIDKIPAPAFPGSPEDIYQKKNSKPLSEAPHETVLDELGRVFRSVVGPAIKGLGATGETILSGSTGLAGAASNIINTVTGAKELPGFKQPGESDAYFLRRNRENFTYQPRTEGGKELAGSIIPQTIGHVVEQGGEGFKQLTGSDAAGELLKDAFAVTTAGSQALKPKAAASPLRLPAAPKPVQNTTELARALDIAIKPADTKGAAKIGAIVEGVAGSSKLDTQLSIRNQPKISKHVRDDLNIDLPEGMLGAKKALNDAKKPHNEKYAQVGPSLGNVSPDDVFLSAVDSANSRGSKITKAPAVEALKRQFSKIKEMNADDWLHEANVLRDEARTNRASEFNKFKRLGRAQQQIVNAIEDLLDRTGRARGLNNLMDDVATARVELAKIHSAEEALLPDGSFDAHNLAKQLKDGVPLSGRMRAIAEVAGNHASVTRPALKIRDKTGSSVVDAATLGLRPFARKVLASDTYQNTIGKPAKEIGPNSPLSEYFKPRGKPKTEASPITQYEDLPKTQSSALLQANKMAGDLELQPDQFPNAVEAAPTRARPGDLTAETPPLVRGDVDFTPSEPLLADAMAGNLKTTSDVPQSIPREIAGEPTLAQLMEEATSSLGIAKPKIISQEGLPLKGGEMVDRLALSKSPGRIGREPSRRANNASGESAASAEAISRVKQEKAAGQDRMLIETDDSVRPLTGVDSVDATAKKGQVIAQRGIGENGWTILDRGGLSKRAAEARVNAMKASLDKARIKPESEAPLGDAIQSIDAQLKALDKKAESQKLFMSKTPTAKQKAAETEYTKERERLIALKKNG